jgi:membrane-associated phospholipid phosphatase
MNDPKSHLLTRLLLVFVVTVFLTAISFVYLDKPIAYWADSHHPIPHGILKIISEIPKIFDVISALAVFVVHIFSWVIGRVSPLMSNLTLSSIALVITDFWVEWLKYTFGRYWPRTWVDNNPSLLDTRDYGFHFFFSKDQAYQAFPSAHTALTIAVVTFLALRYPRLRIPAIVVGLSVALSLIALNYHFLGDTIAGAGIGWMVAYSLDAFNEGNPFNYRRNSLCLACLLKNEKRKGRIFD